MSRRAPPREYYEEDIEVERTRDPPRARRHASIEDEIDIRRRRSIPPVEEMDRLDVRERPRDFMRESFDPPEERAPVMRRLREGVDEIPQAGRGDMYMSPPRERRRYRPRDEEVFIRERERERGGDRRRRSERDLVDDEVYFRERAPPRGYESDREYSRGRFDDEQDEVYMRLFRPGRKSARREEIEEYVVGERERERRARPRSSRDGPRFDRREEVDELVDEGERDRPRKRASGEREVEDELIIDERESPAPRPDRRSHGKPRREDEIIMKWKDQPSSGEVDEDEILFRETCRRRSFPDPRLPREAGFHSTDREEGPDEEIRIRSRIRPRPRAVNEEDEEIVIRRGERDRRRRAEEEEEIAMLHEQRERDRRRAIEDDEELVFIDKERNRRTSLEDDEVMSRKSRRKSPPRERSPSLKSIHAPPIHQDIITHHRHIDHGYDVPPRAPTPEIPSTRTSFDEDDVHHRSSKVHKSEEDIVFKYRDEELSVSPTSGPSLDFNNPWEADRILSRAKPKSLIDDEIKSTSARSSRSRAKEPLYREIDVEVEDGVKEKITVEESRSTSRSRARSHADDLHDTAEEWSVAHAPSKDEVLEMSGALNVVEITPKGSMNEEVNRPVEPQASKERHDERWTEITKELVVREAIERLGYEFEETRSFYYIFSFMEPGDIDELVELSDEIRHARRRRIREMQRERASIPAFIPPRPVSWAHRAPPRPAMGTARRMREREWFINTRS